MLFFLYWIVVSTVNLTAELEVHVHVFHQKTGQKPKKSIAWVRLFKGMLQPRFTEVFSNSKWSSDSGQTGRCIYFKPLHILIYIMKSGTGVLMTYRTLLQKPRALSRIWGPWKHLALCLGAGRLLTLSCSLLISCLGCFPHCQHWGLMAFVCGERHQNLRCSGPGAHSINQ